MIAVETPCLLLLLSPELCKQATDGSIPAETSQLLAYTSLWTARLHNILFIYKKGRGVVQHGW